LTATIPISYVPGIGWFDLSAVPLSVTLTPSASLSIPITLTVPASRSGAISDSVIVSATLQESPLMGDSAALSARIGPLARYVAEPVRGTKPFTVTFGDASVGNITDWLWNLGDGVTSTLPSPTHTYATNGAYTVTLTISGPDGSDAETKANYINVSTLEGFSSVSDGNWHTPATWGSSTVPDASAAVTISTGTIITVDADATCYNLSVQPGATLIIPAGVTLTVEAGLVNNGTLSQTLDVGAGSPTRFLHITNSAGTVTEYNGVDITSTLGLGATSVSVQGNASVCTSDVGSPLYVKRCFKITPASNNTATLTLWALTSEQNGIATDNLVIYRFVAGTWLTLTGTSGADGGDYVFVQADTLGFSDFLLGDTADGPTAVTLQDFRNQPARLDIGLLCAALAVGVLSLSVGKLALGRATDRSTLRRE
jgi:PKD repeat protein